MRESKRKITKASFPKAKLLMKIIKYAKKTDIIF